MNLIEVTDASTAAVMFQSVGSLMYIHSISWDHCLPVGVYNTNVNMGARNCIVSGAK